MQAQIKSNKALLIVAVVSFVIAIIMVAYAAPHIVHDFFAKW
jgi:hypothetical protein